MKARRHVGTLAVAFLLLLAATTRAALASASATLPGSSSACRAQTASTAVTHRAGLVVTFGDKSSRLFCIEFAEDSITGLELIKRAGIPLVLSVSGEAVCSVDGEGSSDPTNCFALCAGGGSCQYWAYYRWSSGAWQYSSVGAAARTVHDGDIDGWAWGPGGLSSGAAPGQPGDLCPQPTATATAATATHTRTPVPAATVAGDPTSIATSTAPTSPSPSTIAAAPTGAVSPATKAPLPLSGTAAPVSDAAGVARTPIPSPATMSPTDASAASVAPSPPATPRRSGVIVGANEGERNAARAQRAPTDRTSSWKALIGFGSVASALVAVSGFLWYRRRQAEESSGENR